MPYYKRQALQYLHRSKCILQPVFLIQVAMHLKSVSAIRIKQEIVDIFSLNNETKIVAIIFVLKS